MLITEMAPEIPPRFRGLPIDHVALAVLARTAAAGDVDERSRVNLLRRTGSLRAYTSLPGYADYTVIDERWQRNVAASRPYLKRALTEERTPEMEASLLLALTDTAAERELNNHGPTDGCVHGWSGRLRVCLVVVFCGGAAASFCSPFGVGGCWSVGVARWPWAGPWPARLAALVRVAEAPGQGPARGVGRGATRSALEVEGRPGLRQRRRHRPAGLFVGWGGWVRLGEASG
jgi:hypothetical protein